MTKKTQVQQAIDTLEAEIADRMRALSYLKAAAVPEIDKLTRKVKSATSRRRTNGEGASTDSGNMTYPPA